jgi:transcriptional antiterminator NusG
MKYFVLQVKTRSEEKFLSIYRNDNPDAKAVLYFPKRELKERLHGRWVKKARAVFPGYIILGLDDNDNIADYAKGLFEADGFFRFLPSNTNVRCVKGNDLELISRFIGLKEQVVGVSKVYFDENARVVIVDGPFQGFEGKIVKVDKRKQRAKVKLDLSGESFLVEFSFDVVKKAE